MNAQWSSAPRLGSESQYLLDLAVAGALPKGIATLSINTGGLKLGTGQHKYEAEEINYLVIG